MNSGEIFAWGYGGNGENGNGAVANVSYPVRVGGTISNVFAANTSHVLATVRIKSISISGGAGNGAGEDSGHSLALDENGNVWAWGYNAAGQLGINNTTAQSSPQQIPRSYFNNQAVTAIWACGSRQGWSFALDQTGSLWAWGYNANGQLGIGNNTNQLLPVQVLTPAFGNVSIGNVVKVQTVDRYTGSGGDGASAILTSLGTIYVTGSNGTGGSGVAASAVNSGWMGNNNSNNLNIWTAVGSGPGAISSNTATNIWLFGAGGSRATMLVRDNTGACWTAGYNISGQLGQNLTPGSVQNLTVFGQTKIALGGVSYNLLNVKSLGYAASSDGSTFNVTSVAVVTDNGLSFTIGDNDVGQNSNGNTTKLATWGDTSGIENIAAYVWQPVRSAPNMVGNFDDVMGGGVGANATYYNMHMAWRNKDGRVMVTGASGTAITGSYSATVNGTQATSCFIMTPVAID
jgi:alpha-tubulin suppressor-like RCC1 family protein